MRFISAQLGTGEMSYWKLISFTLQPSVFEGKIFLMAGVGVVF
jgi:hypothetical protein